MITKSDLRDRLTLELEVRDVADAEEIADSIVEILDEEGAFENDEE